MDPRSAIMRVVSWRWTPCFAPMIGSLSFVVLCIAIVPDDIGPTSASVPRTVALRDTAPTEAEDDSEAGEDAPSKKPARNARGAHGAATPKVTNRTSDTLGSFFRAKEALPVEPVDPNPEPPPPPPPPPPTATIFTLPEPAPAATVPLPPGAMPPPPGAEAQAPPPGAAPPPNPDEIPAAPNPDTALTR